jgi:prepilin-type N-terminal cleavage/methylation domain-containing protein
VRASRAPRERGFTIIEVVISLFLMSLVMAGGYAVLLTQQKISRQQTQLQASQQGVAVAMELLQRDIRKAGLGFGFCRYQELSGRINSAVVEAWRRSDAASAARLYAITVDDNYLNAGPDSLVLRWGNPRGDGSADSQPDQAAAIWTTNTVQLYSSAGTVYQDEPFLYPAGCDCGGSGTACTAPDGSSAKPNQLALLYLLPQWPPATGVPVQCSVVEVTSVTGVCSSTATLVLGQGATAPWNRASGGTGGQTYSASTSALARIQNLGPTSATAPALTQVRWRVEPSTTSNCVTPPCLMRETFEANGTTVITSQVVATGIEDLQVSPACDVNGDGLVGAEGLTTAARQADEWFNNVTGDTVTADCLTYPLLRVSLMARTSAEDPGFAPQARPALENRAAASATDRYRRRILSAVVRPPNVAMYLND